MWDLLKPHHHLTTGWGEGSSPRQRDSPVSIKLKVRDVFTPNAWSASAASTSRTPPLRVSRPSPPREIRSGTGAFRTEVVNFRHPYPAPDRIKTPRPSPRKGLYSPKLIAVVTQSEKWLSSGELAKSFDKVLILNVSRIQTQLLQNIRHCEIGAGAAGNSAAATTS